MSNNIPPPSLFSPFLGSCKCDVLILLVQWNLFNSLQILPIILEPTQGLGYYTAQGENKGGDLFQLDEGIKLKARGGFSTTS